MSRWSLLKATLFYHWRANLAVGLGVVAATAVITGALVVGDSVQTSLLDMHLDRLGRIDMAIGGRDRFVREELAAELQAAIGGDVDVAPAASLFARHAGALSFPLFAVALFGLHQYLSRGRTG